MKRFHSLGAAVLLALPVAASAQTNQSPVPGPGSRSPSSGSCGFSSQLSADELAQELTDIFKRVLKLSGYAPTQFVFDLPEGIRAVPPHGESGKFNKDHPQVIGGSELCEIAHSRDQVAFVFAHELAHLQLGHRVKKHAVMFGMFRDWAKQNGVRPVSPAPADWKALKTAYPSDVMGKFLNSNFAKFYEFSSASESEADVKGYETFRRYWSAPCPSAKAAVFAVQRIQDLEWASDADGVPATTHPPSCQRAAALIEKARSSSPAEAACVKNLPACPGPTR